MQLMEIIFGLSTASDIAYVSYMYAVINQKHFKRITSYVRAAALFGKFLAYGSGQLLISTHLVSYLQLCEHRVSLNAIPPTVEPGMKRYFQDAWKHLIVFKSKKAVFKWCIWWVLGCCGTYQVQNYVQNLWALLQQDDEVYNGITECAATLIGM
uniref:Peroxisomal membrane protein PMP22 n=1 Tax=Loa loa TaxID=7209 RepID=A0A1I7VZJ6_LOALO